MEPIELIAGLGNPGERYARTRHNAGFWFLDRLAERGSSAFRPVSRLFGDVCEMTIGARRVRLLKPTTFMNRSGYSIAATLAYFKIPVSRLLVVHDEIDLPVGVIRLKAGGGHGGHNGVRDVISHASDAGFARLRIGVGHPGSREEVVGHVLHRSGDVEQGEVDEAIERGLAELSTIVSGDLKAAMNVLNERKSVARPSE